LTSNRFAGFFKIDEMEKKKEPVKPAETFMFGKHEFSTKETD
jgi:hypothetical protein